jgi:hypothetical protein
MTMPCLCCKTGVTLSGDVDTDGDLIYSGHEYLTENTSSKVRGVPYNGPLCRDCCKAYRMGLKDMARYHMTKLS